MSKTIASIFSITVLFSTLALAQEEPQKEKEETKAQVEVKTDQSTEVTEKEAEVEIWNKVCPVQGNPIEEDTPTVEYNGKLYGFCCPGCDTKFQKKPEKYSKNLSEDGTRFVGNK